MKHYYLFLFLLFLIPFTSKAQVGIETDPEKGSILHIKGTDTDVIVDSLTGRVGLGVSRNSLQEKLEVKGNTFVEGTVNIDGKLILNEKSLIRDSLSTITTAGYNPASALEIIDTTGTMPAMIIEDTDFNAGKYIMTDAEGNAVWKNLTPPLEIAGFDNVNKVMMPLHNLPLSSGEWIVPATSYSNNANEYLDISNYTDITHNPLILTKGRWLILAQYRTLAVTNNQSPAMIYTALVSRPNGSTGSFKKEMVFGVQPEQRGDSRGTPQLFTVIRVEEETEFRIFSLSIRYRYKLQKNTAKSSSFFGALRLSEE